MPEDHTTTNRILLAVTALLSLLGSSIVLYRYLRVPTERRIFQYKLIAALQSCDWLWSLVWIITLSTRVAIGQRWHYDVPTPGASVQCYFKFAIIQSSLFWVSMISYSLYAFVIKHDELDARIRDPIFHFSPYAFGLPLLLALVPIFTNTYAPQDPDPGVTCWISNTFSNGSHWRNTVGAVQIMLFEIIPCLFTIFWVSFVAVKVHLKLRAMQREVNLDEEVLKHVQALQYYPVVLVICWLPTMSKRIVEVFTFGEYQLNALNFIDIPILNLQGFFNAIVYGWNSIPQMENNEFKSLLRHSLQSPLNKSHFIENVEKNNSGMPQSSEQQFSHALDSKTRAQVVADSGVVSSQNLSQIKSLKTFGSSREGTQEDMIHTQAVEIPTSAAEESQHNINNKNFDESF